MTTYRFVFSDAAQTTLAANITSASPSLQVLSGGGALFPALGSAQAFICTLFKSGSPNITEVIGVTGRSGDNFTGLVRNLSGASAGALSWNAGDTVAIVPEKVGMNSFLQVMDLQSQLSNIAVDTGSANAYAVTLSPPPNGHVIGMPIRTFASHSNTGPSTLNDSIGSGVLVTVNGQALVANDIIAGGYLEAVWNGTGYYLTNVYRYSFAQIAAQIAPGQVPVGAVTQWQGSLSLDTSQLVSGNFPAARVSGQITGSQIVANVTLSGSPATTTQAAGNVSSAIATCLFVNPGSSFGTSNYRKNPDGSIHQWGRATVSGTTSITFPVAFPTTCRSFVLTNINSTNQINVSSVNTTVAVVQNGSADVFWEADGN